MQQSKPDFKKERESVFKEIVQAFEHKYSWLGHQAAREMLLSAASWNIDMYSDPPMRYRNHIMLAWERGWLKSTIMRKMAKILGDDMCSTIGKVTDAAMRGSVSGGTFTPPKPLKTPIIISTEFGQTDFEDELLNIFLALLEEGSTNISLNKIGNISQAQKRNVEDRFEGQVEFGESNEFDLQANFVFWGATYDPSKLEDDALRSRFNVVTPEKSLNHEVVESIDNNRFNLSNTAIKDCRRMLRSEKEVETNFTPPSHFYEKYNIIPRESRDIQSYMAARNWWGLPTTPEVMEKYIQHLKHSRRIATMSPRDRVFDVIFNNPLTFQEIVERVPYPEQKVYKILDDLPAQRLPEEDGVSWAIFTGEQSNKEDEDEDPLGDFLS